MENESGTREDVRRWRRCAFRLRWVPFKSKQFFRCNPSALSSSAPLSKLLTSLNTTRVTDRLNFWLMWWLFGGRISKNIHHNFPRLKFIRGFFCSVNRRKPRIDSVYDDSRPIDFSCRIISVPSTLSVCLSVCVRDISKTYQWILITFFWRGMLWAKEELIRFLRRRWIRMIAISSLKLNNKKHLNVNMFRIEYLCLILIDYSCFISDMTFPTRLVKII